MRRTRLRPVGAAVALVGLLAGCSSSAASGTDAESDPTALATAPGTSGLPQTTAAPSATSPLTGAPVPTGASTAAAGGKVVVPASCPSAAAEPPNAAGYGKPVTYAGTGTGSYTAPDGTGASYPFPPRWTYVWRPTEHLVELTANDALGVWGVAVATPDERLSRVSALYLTAPDGRGGSLTFSLRLAGPLPFTALEPGTSASGRASDESLEVTVRRPKADAVFDVVLRPGRCPGAGGFGPGTVSVTLAGAVPPWSSLRLGFDVRLEDDQLKGELQLRRT
jgi:hypothetical protein